MVLRFSVLFLLLVLCGPAASSYPTLERVDYVLTCMKKKGGQTVENLYACSCEIDFVAENISFDDYTVARTFEIYKAMPGEKGGLFRRNDANAPTVEKLNEIQIKGARKCDVRRAGSP